MNQAVLVFTFSPIQSFIAEARRPADAFAGSRILSELSIAAGKELQVKEKLIYPANLSQDVPNKLVALVPQGQVAAIAEKAETALRTRWLAIAKDARSAFITQTQSVAIDGEWDKIWTRQVENFPWEVYWAAHNIDVNLPTAEGYLQAYLAAESALNAIKRLREFDQTEPEIGQKDSLSGVRQALKTARDRTSNDYWSRVALNLTPAELRKGERLDAIGLIKRFWPADFGGEGGYVGFPSTSSIASHLYWQRVINSPEVATYRDALRNLNLPRVRENAIWPYDGDYLYPNSLDGLGNKGTVKKLEGLHKKHGQPPTYYAIVVMDGDNMGARINNALAEADPKAAHEKFSKSLSDFAASAPAILNAGSAFSVYLGGDDVLFFSPLETALDTAWELAKSFRATGSTASGGVAIVHHTFPLSAALRAARQAEKSAKNFIANGKEKDAISIQALKRSGETLSVTARWEDLPHYFWVMIDWFKNGTLSARFAYELKRSAYFLPENVPMIKAELHRLLQHHQGDDPLSPHIDADVWAQYLAEWASTLPGGLDEIADWVLLARFLAKGGDE